MQERIIVYDWCKYSVNSIQFLLKCVRKCVITNKTLSKIQYPYRSAYGTPSFYPGR
jgi:hypothetical protein